MGLADYLNDAGSEYVDSGHETRSKSKPRRQPKFDGWNGGYKKPKPSFRARRDNGETGTGEKSSGKRNRCGMDDCQAFESPAKSGYCSFHESQHLNEGEKPAELKQRLCLECHGLCEPPIPGEDENQYCRACEEFRDNPHGEDDWISDPL
jgi:hypothetical protein